MRVGFGYDVHRFTSDRPLKLGGVELPSDLGLLGHSDADALLHAIIDALLGAAALGDIGTHFPPSNPAYKDISSLILLKDSVALIKDAGFTIGNIDTTVVCERPRLAPHITKIREAIATTLGIDISQISVKATTTEGLGFTGSGEGLSAYAVVLLNEGKSDR